MKYLVFDVQEVAQAPGEYHDCKEEECHGRQDRRDVLAQPAPGQGKGRHAGRRWRGRRGSRGGVDSCKRIDLREVERGRAMDVRSGRRPRRLPVSSSDLSRNHRCLSKASLLDACGEKLGAARLSAYVSGCVELMIFRGEGGQEATAAVAADITTALAERGGT